MSQLVRYFPIKPLYFSILVVSLFFAIKQPSWLSTLVLIFLLLRLSLGYAKSEVFKTMRLLLLLGLVFMGQEVWSRHQMVTAPAQVRQIRLLPDTIKVNGDSLSFRGKQAGRLYQVYYKIPSEEEQAFFKKLTAVTDLTIEGSLEEADRARNFGGFDYRAYLHSQGISQILTIERIQTSQAVRTLNPWEILSSLRRKALVWIKTSFPAPMNNYMTGLLFGSLDSDFEEMNELYSSLGIIHLFALSGMQVGFFLDAFRKILLRLGVTLETVQWLQLPFSFVYAGLTGFSVSVVRSLVQRLLGAFGISSRDNFALTLLVLFVLMPNFLLTTGGILSCAYAFLLSFLDFEKWSGIKKVLVESAVLSIGILPILLFYFSEFQPWSILLTFAFSLIFDVLLLPGLTVIFLLSPIIVISQINGFFLLLEQSIRWLASLSSRPLVLGRPDPWQLLALLLLLGLLYDVWKRKSQALLVGMVILVLFVLVKHPLDNEVTLLDAKGSQVIFVRDWQGKTLLFNTGGQETYPVKEVWKKRQMTSTAERHLLPYLKSRGVSQLDSLVLTQDKVETMGDLPVLLKQMRIKKIYVSQEVMGNQKVLQELQKSKAQLIPIREGLSIPIMGSQLTFLDGRSLYGQLLGKKILVTDQLVDSKLEWDLAFAKDIQVQLQPQQRIFQALSQKEGLKQEMPMQGIYRTSDLGALRIRGSRTWQLESVNGLSQRLP